jgi:hypothetical protein
MFGTLKENRRGSIKMTLYIGPSESDAAFKVKLKVKLRPLNLLLKATFY